MPGSVLNYPSLWPYYPSDYRRIKCTTCPVCFGGAPPGKLVLAAECVTYPYAEYHCPMEPPCSNPSGRYECLYYGAFLDIYDPSGYGWSCVWLSVATHDGSARADESHGCGCFTAWRSAEICLHWRNEEGGYPSAAFAWSAAINAGDTQCMWVSERLCPGFHPHIHDGSGCDQEHLDIPHHFPFCQHAGGVSLICVSDPEFQHATGTAIIL